MSYRPPPSHSPGQKRKRDSDSDPPYLPVAPPWGSSAAVITPDPAIMALVPRLDSEDPPSDSEGPSNPKLILQESKAIMPELALTAEDMMYKTCRTYFRHSDDILKFEENASNRGGSGLTLLVTRPDGQVRKYSSGLSSDPTLSPRNTVSQFAIRHGVLKFLENGQDPISEGQTIDGVEASVVDSGPTALDSVTMTTPSDVLSPDVHEIEHCCRVWRTDKVTPLFLAFGSNPSAHWGALCNVKLSSNTAGCWSVPSVYSTPAKARAAVAGVAIDDGVIELIQFGNGQFAPNQGFQNIIPEYHAVGADCHSLADDSIPASPSVSLEVWLKDIPSPYPHGISLRPALGGHTASRWIESVMSEAVTAGKASVLFLDVDDATLTRLGCLLRIDFQGLASKSWFVDAIFATKNDARTAVSFQAICLGGFDAFASRWTRASARTSSRSAQMDSLPPLKRIKLEPVELKMSFDQSSPVSPRRFVPVRPSPSAPLEIASVPSTSSTLTPRPKKPAPPSSSTKQKRVKQGKSSPGETEVAKSKKVKKKEAAERVERAALEEFSSLLETELALADLPTPQYHTFKNKKGKSQASVVFNLGEGKHKTYIGPSSYSDDEGAKLGALQVAKVANIIQQIQQSQAPPGHKSPPLSARSAGVLAQTTIPPANTQHLSEPSRSGRITTLPSLRSNYGPGMSHRELNSAYRGEHRQIASLRHDSSRSRYNPPSPESSRYLPSYPDRQRPDRWDGTRGDDSFGSTTGQMFGWGEPTPKRGTASWQAGNRYAWRTIPPASPVNETVRDRDYEPLRLAPIRFGMSSNSTMLPASADVPRAVSNPSPLTAESQDIRQTAVPTLFSPPPTDHPIDMINLSPVMPSDGTNAAEDALLHQQPSPAPSPWSPSQVPLSYHRQQSDMDLSKSSVSGDDADDETNPERGQESQGNVSSSDVEAEQPKSSRVEEHSSIDDNEADVVALNDPSHSRSSSELIVISSRSPSPNLPRMTGGMGRVHRLPPSSVQMALVNYPSTSSPDRTSIIPRLGNAGIDNDEKEDGEIADQDKNMLKRGRRGRRKRGSRSRSPERQYWKRSRSRSGQWSRR